MYVYKPQITMKALLAYTTFLGIGLGLLLLTIDHWRHGEHSIPPGKGDLYKTLQFFATGAFIGTGFFGFFNRPRLGTYVGIMLEVIWCLACSVAWTGWAYSWRMPIFRIVFILSCAVIALGCFTTMHKLFQLWNSKPEWSREANRNSQD